MSNGKLRVADLFCGAGGLSQGFVNAGFEVVLGVDHDQDSCETFRHNHPDAVVLCEEINGDSPERIAAAAGGPVDVVIGGPSCQGFSTANQATAIARRRDPRNRLWEDFCAVVERLEPTAFVMENVPGLQMWQQGNYGEAILEHFEKLGYATIRHVVHAADYGVPQRRRRLIVIGIRGQTRFEFKQPPHLGGWRRDHLDKWERRREELGLLRHVTCWEAIADLPSLGDGGSCDTDYVTGKSTPYTRLMRNGERRPKNHEARELGPEHLALVREVPSGGTWRDIPAHRLPDRFRGMRRTDSTNLFGRLAPDLPAYTITTQFDNVTTGCVTHPYEDRPLSVREGARLQSFPDSYHFVGPLSSQYRQVGNAVPPLLAEFLAESLMAQLDGIDVALKPKVKPAKEPPAPPASSKEIQKRMQGQRRRDTKAEQLVRTELRKLGVRYRGDVKPLPGINRKADIVIRKAKVAVFVHGCFWHGCPDHSRATRSNTKWWAEKIKRNRERDADTQAELESEGWAYVPVWEHEEPALAAQRIKSVVEQRLAACIPTKVEIGAA